MSIEEKQQILEFSCTIDGMKEVQWQVKYDHNEQSGLFITGNGQTFQCPVELFGDVTDFLQRKNIIKSNGNTRTLTAPTSPTTPFATPAPTSTLAPPVIDGHQAPVGNAQAPIGGDKYLAPLDALASFDIDTTMAPIVNVDGLVTDATTAPIPAPSEPSPEGVSVSAETEVEKITRPVIRTRVTGNDPMSAENEAKILRGQGKAGAKKTIKPKHQVSD